MKAHPSDGYELSAGAKALMRAANKTVPSELALDFICDEPLIECPWCEEAQEDDGDCAHCGKLFVVRRDNEGDWIAVPRMSGQDKEYLEWLSAKNGRAA